MIKKTLLLALGVSALSVHLGYSAQPDKKKITFGETKVESSASYKTLEIRYILKPMVLSREIEIDGITYKCFSDRSSAIKYYNMVKNTSEKTETYYVTTASTKTTEVFTFRISD